MPCSGPRGPLSLRSASSASAMARASGLISMTLRARALAVDLADAGRGRPRSVPRAVRRPAFSAFGQLGNADLGELEGLDLEGAARTCDARARAAAPARRSRRVGSWGTAGAPGAGPLWSGRRRRVSRPADGTLPPPGNSHNAPGPFGAPPCPTSAGSPSSFHSSRPATARRSRPSPSPRRRRPPHHPGHRRHPADLRPQGPTGRRRHRVAGQGPGGKVYFLTAAHVMDDEAEWRSIRNLSIATMAGQPIGSAKPSALKWIGKPFDAADTTGDFVIWEPTFDSLPTALPLATEDPKKNEWVWVAGLEGGQRGPEEALPRQGDRGRVRGRHTPPGGPLPAAGLAAGRS